MNHSESVDAHPTPPEMTNDPICMQHFQGLLTEGLKLMRMWYPSSRLPPFYAQLTEQTRKLIETEAWPFFKEIYDRYAKLPNKKVKFADYFYQFPSQSAHFLDALYHGLVQPR